MQPENLQKWHQAELKGGTIADNVAQHHAKVGDQLCTTEHIFNFEETQHQTGPLTLPKPAKMATSAVKKISSKNRLAPCWSDLLG